MWKLVFGLAFVGGVVVAAELLGRRPEVYAGAAGGLLLGLVGLVAAVRIVARHRALVGGADQGHDIWAIWGAGLLARFVLLGVLAAVFVWIWGDRVSVALLTLAVVYLVLLFAETAWLYVRLTDERGASGTKHG